MDSLMMYLDVFSFLSFYKSWMEHLYWLFQLWCICAACGMVLRAGYVCSSSLYRAHFWLVDLLCNGGMELRNFSRGSHYVEKKNSLDRFLKVKGFSGI